MKCRIYPAEDGHRWRLKSSNGRIVADSGEAYTRSYDAKKAFLNMMIDMKIEGVEIEVQRERTPRSKKERTRK